MIKESIYKTLDNANIGYERAQSHFNGQIQPSAGDVSKLTIGSGLDVLKDGQPDQLGFRQIEVDARDILKTPQILGRIVLWLDSRTSTYHPTVMVPKPNSGDVVRLSRLSMPFVPKTGLTDGIRLGVAVEAETQAPGFGNHGQGSISPSAFEPGHFANWIAAGVSSEHGNALITDGDSQTHKIIESGVPQELASLGIIPEGFPRPRTIEISVLDYGPGKRMPLYWHEGLETNDGAALATFEGAVDLTLGAVFNSMTDEQIDEASKYTEYAIKGA